MRHQRPQNVSSVLTTVATGRPMISNVAFDDSGVGMIVGYTYFFDSTADTRTLGFARINQVDPSSVDWIYYFNINQFMTIDESQQPQVVTVKGKTYASMVGKGAMGLGWICSFATSNFGSLIQKTVTLDTTSELLNMQWIPDI